LILDKPLGLTSTQAIGKARRLVGGKKVGHGGTLDPLATGVLPLAFGEATKIIPYVMDHTKIYDFSIGWGESRSTDDAEGEITATSDKRPTEAKIMAALPRFTGEILQKPPAFSAIKINGERAYDLARAGEAPEMKERPVTIFALELLQNGSKEASFRVKCGKGTYVRSLARDLSLFLGTYGYVTQLRRLAVGSFGIENAISLEKLEELSHKGDAQKALLPLAAALDDIPGLQLTASEAQALRQGMGLLIRPHHIPLMKNRIVLASFQEVPVALVEPLDGRFVVARGFNF
jgi:tRNA pseudouridine55 synthase